MQIDFHHGVTYLVARLAGFSPADASVVAWAAQYVDDATQQGILNFDNRMLYSRIASAHRMLDYRNFEELAAHVAWIPFHFLPGNNGKPADANPVDMDERSFIRRMQTRPDSPPARDMLRGALIDRNAPHSLHRLGITLHVYADTWAHQGFCGLAHEANRAREMQDEDGNINHPLIAKLVDFFCDQVKAATGELVGDALPIGHGAVLSYPDLPYLRWAYTNPYFNEYVVRDNPQDFLSAARHLYLACRRYLTGDVDGTGNHVVPEAALDRIGELLTTFTDECGDTRHHRWLDEIASGRFSDATGSPIHERPGYIAKGPGSWKHAALGETSELDAPCYPFRPGFLGSNWKRFHDALQVHRQHVLLDVLPRYGLLAA